MEPVTFAEQAWDGEPGRLGSLLGGPGRLGPPILVGGEWGGHNYFLAERRSGKELGGKGGLGRSQQRGLGVQGGKGGPLCSRAACTLPAGVGQGALGRWGAAMAMSGVWNGVGWGSATGGWGACTPFAEAGAPPEHRQPLPPPVSLTDPSDTPWRRGPPPSPHGGEGCGGRWGTAWGRGGRARSHPHPSSAP